MEPRLVEVPEKWAKRIGDGRMLIPTPLLVDKAIRQIPKGRLATVNMIRDLLAGQCDADMTCPLTTGIFLNIAANAAEEERAAGKKRITPWWRVIKEGGILSSKFPGEAALQAKLLREEGFDIGKGKTKANNYVMNYTGKLVTFE